MSKNQDPKEVAAKERNEGEVRYIHNAYDIPIDVVRAAMLKVGNNGKPSRSRAKIYAELRTEGYTMIRKPKPLPQTSIKVDAPAETPIENKNDGEGDE